MTLAWVLVLMSACAPTPDSASEVTASDTSTKTETEAAEEGEFQDDFESGDTDKWRSGELSKEAVAVEDDFESGDTSGWEDQSEPDGP